MSDLNDFNGQVIAEFRANAGVVGGPFEGTDLLLLTTTGARSGLERVNPVACRIDGDRIYVFASKAGAPTDPDWFHNLVADPEVTVELGADTFRARATVVEGAERDRIYAAHAADNPGFAAYQEGTDRVIPVVLLDRG